MLIKSDYFAKKEPCKIITIGVPSTWTTIINPSSGYFPYLITLPQENKINNLRSGLQLHDMQTVIFLRPLRHIEDIFSYYHSPLDSNKHSIRYIPILVLWRPLSNKNWMQAFSSIINGMRSTILVMQSMLIFSCLVSELRLTVYSNHMTHYSCSNWLLCLFPVSLSLRCLLGLDTMSMRSCALSDSLQNLQQSVFSPIIIGFI